MDEQCKYDTVLELVYCQYWYPQGLPPVRGREVGTLLLWHYLRLACETNRKITSLLKFFTDTIASWIALRNADVRRSFECLGRHWLVNKLFSLYTHISRMSVRHESHYSDGYTTRHHFVYCRTSTVVVHLKQFPMVWWEVRLRRDKIEFSKWRSHYQGSLLCLV